MTNEEGFGTTAKFLANLGLKAAERVWWFPADIPQVYRLGTEGEGLKTRSSVQHWLKIFFV